MRCEGEQMQNIQSLVPFEAICLLAYKNSYKFNQFSINNIYVAFPG